MTRYSLPHSAAQAASVLAALDILVNYPRKGVQVGGGRHVPIPGTYFPGAPGWVGGHGADEHPADPSRLRITLPPETVAALSDPTARARCTAPQLALLDALVLLGDLPPDWIPAAAPP